MKTYAIDASSANKKQRTGVEEYAFQLIQALKKQPLNQGEKVVLYSPTKLEGELAQLPEQWKSQVITWPVKRGWMKLGMSIELSSRTPDLFFIPAQGLPITSSTNIVTTIHDIGFVSHPEVYAPKVQKRNLRILSKVKDRAAMIGAVSEATKKALIDYGIDENKIFLSRNAIGENKKQSVDMADIREQYNMHKPYILFLGRIDRKKNIETLIDAFEYLAKSDQEIELILIGKDAHEAEKIKKRASLSPFASRIRFMGFIPDEHMAGIMQMSKMLILPSHIEGFGIPIIEAFQNNVPVICSDIDVHKEVAGEAAFYFETTNARELYELMIKVLAKEGVEEKLQKGKERIGQFDWNEIAKELLRVFRYVGSERSS